ncbi:MAG: hypothetical protein PHX04_00400 [Bacilli bacterium]|nr:hypothetical protein [Bacilli bacterium]
MNNASNFSFIGILSGLNKTLGVAKEVIPLIQQTKPLINNVRTAYSLIKDVNLQKTLPEVIPKKEVEKTIVKSSNSPQFFV